MKINNSKKGRKTVKQSRKCVRAFETSIDFDYRLNTCSFILFLNLNHFIYLKDTFTSKPFEAVHF